MVDHHNLLEPESGGTSTHPDSPPETICLQLDEGQLSEGDEEGGVQCQPGDQAGHPQPTQQEQVHQQGEAIQTVRHGKRGHQGSLCYECLP